MDKYSDTTNKAYSTTELKNLSIEIREKFELAISLVEMPPTMRARARINLLERYLEGGIDVVDTVIEKATANRERAKSWLAKQP